MGPCRSSTGDAHTGTWCPTTTSASSSPRASSSTARSSWHCSTATGSTRHPFRVRLALTCSTSKPSKRWIRSAGRSTATPRGFRRSAVEWSRRCARRASSSSPHQPDCLQLQVHCYAIEQPGQAGSSALPRAWPSEPGIVSRWRAGRRAGDRRALWPRSRVLAGRRSRLGARQRSVRSPSSRSGERGPWMRRSLSEMIRSLMLASRRRISPRSSNSHSSLP